MEGTSICIVTMDRAGKLSQLVKSIISYTAEPYEIIIIDNGSQQEGLDFLDSLEPKGFNIIRNSTNLGLSVATNQGLAEGKYDCLIHMDDDALIKTRGWNQTMRDFVMRDEIGLVHPMDTPHSIQHEDYQEISWGLGICWAMPKILFDDIGGYDPGLYHQNECDLGLRVRMTGLQIAGISNFKVIHNDEGGKRSDISLAREHLGVVQFRDKWSQYFRGRYWNYGTEPIYLMQHWPPDQDFWHRYALSNGINLNPTPGEMTQEVIATHPEFNSDIREKFDQYIDEHNQKIRIGRTEWLVWRDIRNDYTHWEWEFNSGAYDYDRNLAISNWYELTGELYTGYEWPFNLLRVG